MKFLVIAGAVIIVALGIWFVFIQNDEGERLPRFSVDFQVPEGAVFEVGKQFSVVSSVTTVTPRLEEYVGKWNPEESYQKPWQLTGFYLADGPVTIVSGKDVIVKRDEVKEPPEETERGISSNTATFACAEPGQAEILFAYTVDQENYGIGTIDADVMKLECVAAAGGGVGAGAQPNVTAPAVNPGFYVCGLPGGPACPPRN